jgi:hypothetical protein
VCRSPHAARTNYCLRAAGLDAVDSVISGTTRMPADVILRICTPLPKLVTRTKIATASTIVVESRRDI